MEVDTSAAGGGSPTGTSNVLSFKPVGLTADYYDSQLQDLEMMLGGSDSISPGRQQASPAPRGSTSDQVVSDSSPVTRKARAGRKKKGKTGKKKRLKKKKVGTGGPDRDQDDDARPTVDRNELKAELAELYEEARAKDRTKPAPAPMVELDDFVVDDLSDEDRKRHDRDGNVSDDNASIRTEDEGPSAAGSSRGKRRSAVAAREALYERIKTERLKREGDTRRLEKAVMQDTATAVDDAAISVDDELRMLQGKAQMLLNGPRSQYSRRHGAPGRGSAAAWARPPQHGASGYRRNWKTPAQLRAGAQAPGGSAGLGSPGLDFGGLDDDGLGTARGTEQKPARPAVRRVGDRSLQGSALSSSKIISFESQDHEEVDLAEAHVSKNNGSEHPAGGDKLAMSSHSQVSLFGGLHEQILREEGDRKLIQTPDMSVALQRSSSTLEEVVHVDSSDDEDDHRMLINPLRRYNALQKRQSGGSPPKAKRSRSGMFSPLRSVAKLRGDQRRQFLDSLKDSHHTLEAEKAARMLGFASVVAHGVGKLRMKLQRKMVSERAPLAEASPEPASSVAAQQGQSAALDGTPIAEARQQAEGSATRSTATSLSSSAARLAAEKQADNPEAATAETVRDDTGMEQQAASVRRSIYPPMMGGHDSDDEAEQEMKQLGHGNAGGASEMEAGDGDDDAGDKEEALPATPSPTPALAGPFAKAHQQQQRQQASNTEPDAAETSPVPTAPASETAATEALPIDADLQGGDEQVALGSKRSAANASAEGSPAAKKARVGYGQVSREVKAKKQRQAKLVHDVPRTGVSPQSQANEEEGGPESGSADEEGSVDGQSEAGEDAEAASTGPSEGSSSTSLARNAAYREAVLAEFKREKERAAARRKAGISFEDEAEEDEDEVEGGARHLIGAMGLQGGQDMKALAAERRKLEEAMEEREAMELEANLDEALEGIVDAVSDDEDDDVSHDFIAEQQRKQDKQELRRITHAMAEGYKRKSRQGLDRLEQRMQEAEAAEFEADEEGALAAAEIARQQRRIGAGNLDADLVAEVEGDSDSNSQNGDTQDAATGGDDDDDDEDDDYDVETMLRKAQREQRRRLRSEANPEEEDAKGPAIAMPRTIMSHGSSILALKQRNRYIASTIARRREQERQSQLQELEQLGPRGNEDVVEPSAPMAQEDAEQREFEHQEWMDEAAAMADQLEAQQGALGPPHAAPGADGTRAVSKFSTVKRSKSGLAVRRVSDKGVELAGGAVLQAPTAQAPVVQAQPTPDVLLRRSASTSSSHVEVFAMLAEAEVEARPAKPQPVAAATPAPSSKAASSSGSSKKNRDRTEAASPPAKAARSPQKKSNPLLKAFSRTVAPDKSKPRAAMADDGDSDSDEDEVEPPASQRSEGSYQMSDEIQYDDMMDIGAIRAVGRGKSKKTLSLGEIARRTAKASARPPRVPRRQASDETEATARSSSLPSSSAVARAAGKGEEPSVGDADGIQRLLREASDGGGAYSQSNFGLGSMGDSMSRMPSFSLHGDEGASRPGGFGCAGLGADGAKGFISSMSRQGDSQHVNNGGRVEVRSQGRKFAFAAAASSKPVGIVPAQQQAPVRQKPSVSKGLEIILGMQN